MITVFIADKSIKLTDGLCVTFDNSGIDIKYQVFNTFKQIQDEMDYHEPDILLLGFDLGKEKAADFCAKVFQKHPYTRILLLIKDEKIYDVNKMEKNGVSGYILKTAVPGEVIASIEKVMEGKDVVCGKTLPSQVSEETPEWLLSFYKELPKFIGDNCNPAEMIEKFSLIIKFLNNSRQFLIQNMIDIKERHLNADAMHKYLTTLIDPLLIEGYTNWEIARILNIEVETIRIYRLSLISRIGEKNSMNYFKKKTGEIVELTSRELQLLRLIAAGYTNDEIAEKLYLSVESIKTNRRDLIIKVGAKNTMSMVIEALRKGLIKIDDIDNLLY